MSVFGFLLRIARAVINSVIQTITQQIQMLQDAITQPLRGIVQSVVAGAWKGDGASRFVEEMTNEVIPQLLNIGNVTTNFGGAIRRAVEVLDRAEQKATQQAQQLYDVFNNIYR